MGGVVVEGDVLDTLACLSEPAAMVYLDPPFGHGTKFRFSPGELLDLVNLAWDRTSDDGIVYLHGDPRLFSTLNWLALPRCCGWIAWQNGWVSGFKSRSTRFWPRQYQLIAGFAREGWRWRRVERPKPEGYVRRGGGGGSGFVVSDWWDDITPVDQASFSKEKVGYPTQKPVVLLKRLIVGSTDLGDLVVDPMCGSGTTAVAAERTGRRFVVGDASAKALRLTRERLVEG